MEKLSINELQKAQIPVFFGKLFQARDITHLIHLKINNGDKHKALQRFYEGFLDFTDTLIESYQGEHGIQNIKIPASEFQEPITFLRSFLETLKGSSALFKDSDYLNVIDEMKTLTKRTLYKLQYLP